MDLRCIILDLDGSLTGQPSLQAALQKGTAILIDARDLAPRLRIIANHAAAAELCSRIDEAIPLIDSSVPVLFYGSGDFHHIAALFIGRLSGPLTLLHFDNHPDWISFPARLNCGGWTCSALQLPCVAHLVTIGPSGADFVRPQWKFANLDAIRSGQMEVHPWRAAPSRLWGAPIEAPGCSTIGDRLVWRELARRPWDEFGVELDQRLQPTPVWVSLDKDALTTDEAITNWDQGSLRLDAVFSLIRRLTARRRLLGIDICGDWSPPVFKDPLRALLSATDRPRQRAPNPAHATAVNSRTNDRIIAALRELPVMAGTAT
jgi:hypothetical protein